MSRAGLVGALAALGRGRRALGAWRGITTDARTPRTARWLILAALAYLVSPFDLVPDWLPVLGQLDDVLIVGLALALAWRTLPPELRREYADAVPARWR